MPGGFDIRMTVNSVGVYVVLCTMGGRGGPLSWGPTALILTSQSLCEWVLQETTKAELEVPGYHTVAAKDMGR